MPRRMRKDLYKKAGTSWTTREVKFVRDNHDKLTVVEMAEVLERSPGSISFRIWKDFPEQRARNPRIKTAAYLPPQPETLRLGGTPVTTVFTGPSMAESEKRPAIFAVSTPETPVVNIMEQPEESVDLTFVIDIIKMAHKEGLVINFNINGLKFCL